MNEPARNVGFLGRMAEESMRLAEAKRAAERTAERRDLRAILESWTPRTLMDIIELSFSDKAAMVSYIIANDLVADETDEIIAHAVKHRQPAVKHRWVEGEHQDCAHVEFDLTDLCRMCRRHRTECEPS
jgi:hypothetical protein